MKTICMVAGKLFRYDDQTCIVEYIAKATKEDIEEDNAWKAGHNGRSLYGIDADGYFVLDSAGLGRENWKNKATREEYLTGWAAELDAEANDLVADFVKYELPYLV